MIYHERQSRVNIIILYKYLHFLHCVLFFLFICILTLFYFLCNGIFFFFNLPRFPFCNFFFITASTLNQILSFDFFFDFDDEFLFCIFFFRSIILFLRVSGLMVSGIVAGFISHSYTFNNNT